MIQRVIAEANNLDEFRELWIETQKRRSLIDHLLGDNFSPEVIREVDQMSDFDLYDFFGHHGYHARALRRPERGDMFISSHRPWFDGMEPKAAIVLKGMGHQFATGGTDALETPALWEVPEIKLAGGLDALRVLGKPTDVMRAAKGRLFGVWAVYQLSRCLRSLILPPALPWAARRKRLSLCKCRICALRTCKTGICCSPISRRSLLRAERSKSGH